MRTSNETQSASNNNNDDLFNDDNVKASMMEFGNGMQKVMINFQTCTERIKDKGSRAISSNIRETRRLREMFREFVKDSLKFNNDLSNYSLEILFFAKCFKDYDNYSKEDILELMNDLLETSRENLRLSKELKNRIKTDDESAAGINDLLIKIQNSLSGHINKINGEIKKEKISALIPKGNGLSSAMTRYVISAFFDVKFLYRKLDEIVTIKDFDYSLKLIILEIGKIETFWEMQTERIEYLVNNLIFGKEIQRNRIAHHLEQKWKNVEKECQIYNRVMKDVLNKDRLNCIE